ncbi:glyoxalase/bleomycin resistance/extradiol dioxygenase family protein [Bacillus clarus]|uniref:Glyoxalase/bleomycin resistance/extradiol dioxygenase family protein n=1 Tax=Bacillus clarus TaxID=2338372 RepID=A0ABX9L065_9BACI|nr:glyoxalase/bleomycin resistance/extradiol dioxygenase family protein [Bacillus clarus]
MMEFYPMPMFVKLLVSDMERSLDWYKHILKFESVFELPNQDGKIVMAHIRGEKYQDLMLVAVNNETCIDGKGIVLNFTVDEIHSFFEEANKRGAKILEGPIHRPWNARELILQDPDCYIVTLSMQINVEKTMDEIVKQVKV